MRRALALAVMLGAAAPAVAGTEPSQRQEEEVGRSGFWTNPHPAVGGAYRWRLLGVGVVLATLTGFGMRRLVRKANAERTQRDDAAKRDAS